MGIIYKIEQNEKHFMFWIKKSHEKELSLQNDKVLYRGILCLSGRRPREEWKEILNSGESDMNGKITTSSTD
jgi:hypothetical protein